MFITQLVIVLRSPVGVLLVLLAATANCDAQLDAAELARRYEGATQSLLPFQCKVCLTMSSTDEFIGSPLVNADYYRSADTIRSHSKSGIIEIDTLYRSGQYRHWMRNSRLLKAEDISGTIEIPKVDGVHCDAWDYALLTLPYDGHRPLSTWLRSTPGVRIRNAQLGGRSLVRAEMTIDKTAFVIWFDLAANYLARRIEKRTAAGSESVFEVDDFAEVSPGIFFPKSSHLTGTKPGEAEPSGWKAVFTNVTAGAPLPADAFAFKFPPGSMVNDLIAGTVKKADANGDPTLLAKTASGNVLKLATGKSIIPSPEQPEQFEAPRTVTVAEPTPQSRWLLLAGLLLIVSAGAIWMARRYRRSTND